MLNPAFKKGEIGQRGQSPFQPSSTGQTFQLSGPVSNLQPSPMLFGGSNAGETNAKVNGLAKMHSPERVVEALVVYGPGLSSSYIWQMLRRKYWTRLCNRSALLGGIPGTHVWLGSHVHTLIPPPSVLPGSVASDDVLITLFNDAASRRKAMQCLLSSGIELVPYTVSSKPEAFVDVRYIRERSNPNPNPTRGMSVSDNSGFNSSIRSMEEGELGQLKHGLIPSRSPSPGLQHNPLQRLPVDKNPSEIGPAIEGGGKSIRRSSVFNSVALSQADVCSVKRLPSPVPFQASDIAASVNSHAMIDMQSEMELHRSRVVATLGSQMKKIKGSARNMTTNSQKRRPPTTVPTVHNGPTSIVRATTPPAEVLNEQLMSSLATCRMAKVLTAGSSRSSIKTDAEKEAQAILVEMMSKGIVKNGGNGACLPSFASDDLEDGELRPEQQNPPTLAEAAPAVGGSEAADEIAKQRELVLSALKLSRLKNKLNNKGSGFSSTTKRGSTEEAVTITTKKKNISVTSSSPVSSVEDSSTLPPSEEGGPVSIASAGGSSSTSTDIATNQQLKEVKLKKSLNQKEQPAPPTHHISRLCKRESPSPTASVAAFINGRANNRIQKFVVYRSSTPGSDGGGNDVKKYPYSIKGAFFDPDGMGVFPSGWANGQHASSSVSAEVKQQKREMELRQLQCKERALRLANIQGRIKRKERELKDLQADIKRYAA